MKPNIKCEVLSNILLRKEDKEVKRVNRDTIGLRI